MERCPWSEGFDLYRKYHDSEWGVPLFDDRALFELLILEGAQAGLSWSTVLKKREHYRLVFNGFNPELIALYNDQKVAELLADPGICLLYTSDAADERSSVDLGGRRIIKKQTNQQRQNRERRNK